MKITCHSCQAKYTVSDDKVQGKTVKMKCRKCGATIVVGGAGSAGAGDAATAQEVEGTGGDLAPGSYLVNVADGDQRTMTLAEVLDAYNGSVVNADTYVWSDGMADWQPLGENATITSALHDAAGGSNGSTPAPAPSAPESTRPAARKEPARRNDLFGGGGGGFSDAGGLSSSVSASSAGKRDENSVLFSLSALTSATAPSKSSPLGTKEDSGLIDLRALAATATPSPAHAPSPVAESAAMFPLGAPMLGPPPVAHQAMSPVSMVAPPQPKSMAIPLAIGAFLAVGAIGGVFLLLKGSPPPPAPVVAQTAVAAPDPIPTVAAAPTQTAAAADTASAAPSPSGSAVAAAKPVIHGTGVGAKPNPGTAKPGNDTPAKPATPAKPVSGKGTCGCAPGDLMCAMKCSAK